MQQKIEVNSIKSYIKCLYFNDNPRAHRTHSPISPKRVMTLPAELSNSNTSKLPVLSTKRSISGSKNDISLINDISSSKQNVLFKKKLHYKYIHMPLYLPNIVKDRNINKTKKTMIFFNNKKEFLDNPNKKCSLPFLFKEDNLKAVKNAQNINRIQYDIHKYKKEMEDTSKMLIKELWHKSYHKKVLDLSGLQIKQEKLDNQKMQTYETRFHELDHHFIEPLGHMKFLYENEKNISDFINLSMDPNHHNTESFIKREENSIRTGNNSKLFKGEIDDLLDKCREFHDVMKKEKKLFFFSFS